MGLTKRLGLVYKPLGVVGLITPWNGPVALSVNPTVQALLGSCMNAGHCCCANERVYVGEEVYAAFVERVVWRALAY